MSLEITKKQLVRLLADSDNKVIALSGRWGTGKSHLWKEVRESSKDESVKEASYVSLFGLNDLNQIKLKVLQSYLPRAQTGSKASRVVNNLIDTAYKNLSGYKAFAALRDVASLALPRLLRGKIAVLDILSADTASSASTKCWALSMNSRSNMVHGLY